MPAVCGATKPTPSASPSFSPGFKNFLHWLDFDSFPIFWLLVIRIGHDIGLGSDASFRILGCFVGLGLIVALWVNARAFRHTLPFASLILLGFCSSVLRWGDSIRAYGFGMLWVILSFSTMWLAVRQPTRRHILLAGVVAVLERANALLIPFCFLRPAWPAPRFSRVVDFGNVP